MPKKLLTNPHAFRNDCKNCGVTYDLLIEAQKCLGKQACSKLFKGKCARGGGNVASSSLIEDWLITLKFSIENPDKKDNDPYKPRTIDPLDAWYDFLQIVKTPIDENVIEFLKSLSPKKLGVEIKKYGMIYGTANSKSLKTLKNRVLEMIERRKQKFWIIELEEKEKTALKKN